ncbi:MAG: hypothetical protein M1818_007275 [Claussenomyces sp. TS43310]|nr:MAG: hypothetical protein M1818_007275 [Claussenomyces sp. TS43310]
MNILKNVGRRPDPSGTTSVSSIRGKISAPIPIIPMDDEEFPMRASKSGIATPASYEVVEDPLRFAFLGRGATKEGASPHTSLVAAEWSKKVSARQDSSGSASRLTNQSTNTTCLGKESGVDTIPKASTVTPKRKKSISIKEALGRLFGKRRKTGSTAIATGRGRETREVLRHSDPSVLRGPKHIKTTAAQRPASMPLNDFNRALHSHTPDVEEVRQRHKESTSSIVLDDTGSSMRTTTSSWILMPPMAANDIRSLTPRPASERTRGSRSVSGDQETHTIGTASTRDYHKRRPRSLDYLPESHISQSRGRPRSDEIQSWRKSCEGDRTFFSGLPLEDAERANLSTRDDGNGIAQHNESQPVFGSLKKITDVEITQAATLETEMAQLESRLQVVESLVLSPPEIEKQTGQSKSSLLRPCHHGSYQESYRSQADASDLCKKDVFRLRTNSRPSISAETSSVDDLKCEFSSFSIRSIPRSYTEDVAHALPIPPSHESRPLSTSTTVQAVNSSSPPHAGIPYSQYGTLTAHHYSALLNLITAEQAARHRLEIQLLKVKQKLQIVLSSHDMPDLSIFSSSSSPDQTERQGFNESTESRADGSELSFSAHDTESAFGSQNGETPEWL